MVLPFVVEHAGALGKEAMGFFRRCKAKAKNKLSSFEEGISTWSIRGFSNFYLMRISVANLNLKGLGHFFSTAAEIIHHHNNSTY